MSHPQAQSDSPRSFWGVSSAVAPCAPPLKFRPAVGVRAAWPCESGPFARPLTLRGKTVAQKAGLRYEKKVLNELSERFGSAFHPSPWLRFTDETGTRYCQPDGLLIQERGTFIFEVKYSFVSDAWFQLRRLYGPVVERAYRPAKIFYVVICRNYDVARPFPEVPHLFKTPSELVTYDGDATGVLSWML